MNERSIISAPEPDPRGGWLDAYMDGGGVATYQSRPQLISWSAIRGIAFRQRWMILGVIATALIGGIIITLLATPMYEADAKVSVEPFGNAILEGEDVASQSVSPNQIYDYLATQVEIIKSRAMAEIVAEDLKLSDRTDLLGKGVDESRPPNITDEQWREKKRNMAVDVLVGSVTSEVPSENWVIPIGYRSSDPTLAAEIANAYASAFISWGSRKTVSENQYALDYLKQQIEKTRERLATAEASANEYARNSGIIVQPLPGVTDDGSAASVTLTGANLANINQRVTDARAARIAAEQRWRSIENLPAAQLPEVQSNQVLMGLISDRTAKQAQLAELRERYNDDFPQVQNLLAQISVLNQQIERSSTEVKAAVKNDYIIARNREKALQSELDSLTSNKLVEQDQQVQLSVLDREAQALRDQLKALLDRYNQINSAANVQRGEVTRLDAATVPTSPYSPNVLRNMALALVLGIAFGGALAVLRETLDDRVRSLEDVEERVGLTLLGYTPHVAERDFEAEGSNRFSALMEAYSSIRAAIDFSLPRGRTVLQLTSSQASEGKSTTAVILSELFASLGRKTLLIDGDLRRPSVAGLLDVERPKAGLVEVLLGHLSLDDALLKGIHDNLDILPVGEIPPNPTEILASPAMREFLERERDNYDLILIDCSPVLGLADAPVLSRLVDGTVFVLEANRVPYGQVRSAVRRLKFAGANILGLVLTKYRALEAGETYSYQYEYYRYDNNRSGR
ncbi:MAG: polysaccharide biosynthesis tyrosine autokinase [Porphyrobacter sp.]|nr:polysaccharide biosynthesis tyrosine autokinase [Porphyrobacter sp.]